MVSHEYGSKTFRPHHHVLIFGYSPNNQKLLKTTNKGHPIFTSTEISELWKNGFHSIGDANAKTAYYIAAYALKGKQHDLEDPITGEITTVNDSFDCSKRPGIGYNYLLKNSDQIITAAVKTGNILPRYYQKKLIDINPEMLQYYEDNILLNVKLRGSHQVYAKYKISQAKKYLADSEFRSAPKTPEDFQMENHLFWHLVNDHKLFQEDLK